MKTSQINRLRAQCGRAWLTVLIPLVLIAAAAGVYVLSTQPDPQDEGEPLEPSTLQPGQDYYLMVRTIELYPMRPGGEIAWDRIDGSGPDIQYSLTWQGNVVFESQKKSDTLIGSWDALSINVKKAVLSGKVDLAGSIDAALIHVEEGTEVAVKVWDSDLPGSDEAGGFTLPMSEMALGDTTLDLPNDETNAIKRVVVRVIDKALPVTELVEEATRP